MEAVDDEVADTEPQDPPKKEMTPENLMLSASLAGDTSTVLRLCSWRCAHTTHGREKGKEREREGERGRERVREEERKAHVILIESFHGGLRRCKR